MNERSIKLLLRLIACDNSKIGTYTKLVQDRNQAAHTNGNIFYSEQSALDLKITEILHVVDQIQTHSKCVIEHWYQEFLLQNHDTDEREYPDSADQIREVLIQGNYLSQKDIEICLGYAITGLDDNPQYDNILALHNALISELGSDDEGGAL
jgi:hypothetical protein